MKYFLTCATLSFLLLHLPGTARAQMMQEVQPLDFGRFALSNNNTPQSLTVTPQNDFYHDAGVVSDTPGRRAIYELSEFPENVSFYIGIDVPNPPTEGGIVLDNATPAILGGEGFTLDDLTIANGGILQTDGDGEAILYIGGTLRSSGSGQRYLGGTYSGTYTITFHY